MWPNIDHTHLTILYIGHVYEEERDVMIEVGGDRVDTMLLGKVEANFTSTPSLALKFRAADTEESFHVLSFRISRSFFKRPASV